MTRKPSKQIVYRYNGDPKSEETAPDPDGDIKVPEKGSIIERNGSRWKVIEIMTETSVTHPDQWPIVRIFLASDS